VRGSPGRETRLLRREQWVPRPPGEVFAFFSRPENLEELTPPLLRFQILTPSPVPMAEGALIDYRIRIFGIPTRWRTLIETYEPGVRFVDVQVKGPYALWRHEHLFEGREGGTLITDRVEYHLPFGPLGTMAHALWIQRTLRHIFDYRQEAVAALFG
jgi:hypothetical protein